MSNAVRKGIPCLSETFVTMEEEEALRKDLASRGAAHYGVPVGAVLTPMRAGNKFRKLLEKCVGKVKYRGLARLPKIGAGFLLVSLPCDAACAFEAEGEINDGLLAFMKETGTVYYSGVRLNDAWFKRKDNLFRYTNDKGDSNTEIGDAKISRSCDEEQRQSSLSDFTLFSSCVPSFAACMRDETQNDSHQRINRFAVPSANFTFAELFAGIGGFRLGLGAI